MRNEGFTAGRARERASDTLPALRAAVRVERARKPRAAGGRSGDARSERVRARGRVESGGMRADALRRFALSLPESSEQPHFERTSFRTRKKIFATLTRDGREAMVKLADPDEAQELLARSPETFLSYGAWTTRGGALGVRLARVDPGLMRALVTAAWKSVASKRALAALAARDARAPGNDQD
jgi:hypothetical protein